VPLLVLAALAGCGGGDDERPDETRGKAIDGTFVGDVAGSDAFVAIVAGPAEKGKETRPVTLYASDGGGLSESLAGTVRGNAFTATSDDGDAKASGRLGGDSVSGTLTLPDGGEAAYRAARATAAAGLYDLTVSARGRLSGASANGVALTSEASLRAPGSGRIEFADGKRRRFRLTADAPDPVQLGAGRLRLIVTPEGELSGGGAAQADGGELELYIRSAGR
jgi:hypothetical protein